MSRRNYDIDPKQLSLAVSIQKEHTDYLDSVEVEKGLDYYRALELTTTQLCAFTIQLTRQLEATEKMEALKLIGFGNLHSLALQITGYSRSCRSCFEQSDGDEVKRLYEVVLRDIEQINGELMNFIERISIHFPMLLPIFSPFISAFLRVKYITQNPADVRIEAIDGREWVVGIGTLDSQVTDHKLMY